MARHVYENIASLVGIQALRARRVRRCAPLDPYEIGQRPAIDVKGVEGKFTCKQANEILNADLVSTIIDLYALAIQIKIPSCVCINFACKGVAGVACYVVSQHQDDVGVWNAQSLHGPVPVKGSAERSNEEQFCDIHAECIGHMLIRTMI